MNKKDVLEKSIELITTNREKDYGSTHTNFGRIAKLWSVVFEPILKEGAVVEPFRVALAMDQLKTARLVETPDHADSWFDKGGYVGIGGELALNPAPEAAGPAADNLEPATPLRVGDILEGSAAYAAAPVGTEVECPYPQRERSMTKVGDGRWWDPYLSMYFASEELADPRKVLVVGKG